MRLCMNGSGQSEYHPARPVRSRAYGDVDSYPDPALAAAALEHVHGLEPLTTGL